MHTLRTCLLLCLSMAAPGLHAAEANKCVDAYGNIMLTDEPCNTLPVKRPPALKGQAKPPETLTPPQPEPILPPPDQPLPSPPAPAPAAPAAPISPGTQPMQR